MNPRQFGTVDRIRALVVGKQGSGKSAAIASIAEKYIPEKKKLKVFDIDQRFMGAWGARDYLPDEIWDAIDVDLDLDANKGFAVLEKRIELMIAQQAQGTMQYGGILLESQFSLQQMLIRDSQRLKGGKGGRILGSIHAPAPDDFQYASLAFRDIVYNGFYKLKCDVFLSGWIVDQWGKPGNDPEDTYKADVVTGQKLLATNKMAEETPGYFDEVWMFNKDKAISGGIGHSVTFYNTLAKTSKPELKAKGTMDITGKSFYREYMKLMQGSK